MSAQRSVRLVRSREAAPSGAEVRELYLQAFGAPPLNEGEAEANLFSQLYERALDRSDTVVTLSRIRDRVVGICYGHPWHWHEQTGAWAQQMRERLPDESVAFVDGGFAVYLLAVNPHEQRVGLGSALLTTALSKSECERAWLITTDVDSPALRLYRSRGWRVLGHGADAPDGRPGVVLGWRSATASSRPQQRGESVIERPVRE